MDDYSESPALDAALISAAQKVEHYEIAAYGTLRAFARRLGNSRAERLALANARRRIQSRPTPDENCRGRRQRSGGRSHGLNDLPPLIPTHFYAYIRHHLPNHLPDCRGAWILCHRRHRAAWIAKILFVAFLVLFLVSLITGEAYNGLSGIACPPFICHRHEELCLARARPTPHWGGNARARTSCFFRPPRPQGVGSAPRSERFRLSLSLRFHWPQAGLS